MGTRILIVYENSKYKIIKNDVAKYNTYRHYFKKLIKILYERYSRV